MSLNIHLRSFNASSYDTLNLILYSLSIPNVQTIDDLLVEKCQPGDVILFDRRCECCATGAISALGCLLGKTFLCDEDDGTRSVEKGSYEHCGEFSRVECS